MGDSNKGRAFDTFDLFGTRKAERGAKKKAKKAQAEIAGQKRKEELRLAEEEDVIGRKKLLAKKGGRSLLVATSPTGMINQGSATTLGGGQ
jgi:hypothetical protein